MKTKHLYLPLGEINPFGNGSEKRTTQIYELLNQEFDLEDISKKKRSFFSTLKTYQSGISKGKQFNIPFHSIKDIALAGYNFLNCKKFLSEYPLSNPLLIWESTLLTYHFLPYMYKKLGCKTIGFPHNLESLVIGQKSPVSGVPSPGWFKEELNQLKQCEHIFTISEEENWLLSLYNLNCTYFPYYPPKETEIELLDIRKHRSTQTLEDYYLIFGSFNYGPIKKGLVDLIHYLQHSNIQTPIKITGYGSDLIKNEFERMLPNNIQILGPSSKAQLHNLLLKCKGVLVNQANSSGALTKLKELQIAGIPVIVNSASARSYRNQNGIFTYHVFDEIEEIINKEPGIPDLPKNNDHFNHQVIDIIKQYIP